jgi:hypothetical protein
MKQSVGRWLVGLGAVTVAAVSVPGLTGLAAASPVAAASPAAEAGPAGPGGAAAYVPAGQVLHPGMRGAAVKNLQERLAELKYYPGKIDGEFGPDTLEAVWAFKEVQGISTSTNADVVSRVIEHDLINPRQPKALVPRGGSGLRVEVSKKIEVLVLYRHNKAELISHVSTGGGCLPGQGCGWITPDGNYRATSFLPGWVTVPLGYMYNPVFFISRTYAIHGEYDASVPLGPASHGCVRIPLDIAAFFYKLVRISPTHGTPVYIRG